MHSKIGSLTVIAAAQVMAMSVWFSATAAVPALLASGRIDAGAASLLTSAVQAGFVIGTLTSALLGLADRYDERRLFAAAAATGALANAGLLLVEPDSIATLALRLATGAAMAGVYPVGMKLAASWARGDMGLLVAVVVAAVSLGAASPHLLAATGGADWQAVSMGTSLAALLAAGLIFLARPGPARVPARAFRPAIALASLTQPALRLANFGYLGHMWELYAMWAWLGLFLEASFSMRMATDEAVWWARIATFASIGAGGALGCLAGGLAADRFGRTRLTIAAMLSSAGCAITAGFLFGAAPLAVFLLCLVWGIAVIADSAQFSASIAELSDRDTVGTMLTAQTCAGFLLTLATIHLMPAFVEAVGWRYAFAGLAAGPLLGALAMAKLRARPEARRLAGGIG